MVRLGTVSENARLAAAGLRPSFLEFERQDTRLKLKPRIQQTL